MVQQRRDFLRYGVQFVSLSQLERFRVLSSGSFNQSHTSPTHLAIGHTDLDLSKYENIDKKTAVDVPGKIVYLTLRSDEISSFDVPFLCHSIAVNPKNHRFALGVAKYTSSSAVIDLQQKSIVQMVKTPP